MRDAITDPAGYAARQEEIDQAILKELEGCNGRTNYELAEMLRQMGIGNARNSTRIEVAYSTTGAITRTAVNSLRSRGLIYDSWDTSKMAIQYERPFRFFHGQPGRITSGDGSETPARNAETTEPTAQS